MSTVRRSLFFSLAEKYCVAVINIGSTMILSRLLTPRDTGIFTIGVAFVGLAHILRDFGVSNYLIQEMELTGARLRSTFGVTIITSWSVGFALALLSGQIAGSYHEPAVQPVIAVLSLNFFIIPFGAMALILLRREMNFGAVFRVGLVSTVVHAVTAVLLAFRGLSYMSVAWSSVAGNLAITVMTYIERPSHLKLIPGLSEWRRVASYGVFMAGTSLVGELGNRAPDIIIGRTLGLTAVGLLSKANGLTTLFETSLASAIRPVATSSLAITHRSGGDLRSDFLTLVSHVTVTAWPFYAVCATLMFPIIRVLFGDQWDAAVPLARILCLAGFVSAIDNMNYTVYAATGAVKQQFSIQSIVQFVKIALIAFTSLKGLTAVAFALVAVAVAQTFISYHYMNKLIGTSTATVLRAAGKSLGVTLCSMIVPLLLMMTVSLNQPPFLLWCALGFSGAFLGWLLGIAFFRHPIASEILRFGSRWRTNG